jgi:inhibitor of KinA sporulation pathway (predicted exonuclease)
MNPIKDQNYFSLDLELNNLNNGQVPKIIEVGIAFGSPVTPEAITRYNWYLDPQEPISPFITQLTGITDEIIKEKSVSHETVAEEIGSLIQLWDCFPNPITWGQGDADELKAEFRERNIRFPFFGRRIFDVKTICVFNQMVQGKSPGGGLRKSMNSYGLNFEGEPHRAAVDATNTLRFFFYLLNTERKLQETIQQLKEL